MNVMQRINALAKLGHWLRNLGDDEFQTLADEAARENPWFTKENVRLALAGVARYLEEDAMRAWVEPYRFSTEPRRVALVMAGNIPLVGFHDFLAVLISGHTVVAKLSSKDTSLIRTFMTKLLEIEPGFQDSIVVAEQLRDFHAVIATGSDNTARYFEYYFGKYPHIIRKNRTSVAVLDGSESNEDLVALGGDVFSYFGLGCRNVAKVLVPAGYDVTRLLHNWEPYHDIIHHHKYCNNYDYQKSILLVNGSPFLDNNFVLLQQHSRLVSPIAVVYYEHYDHSAQLEKILLDNADKIQCIVGTRAPATVLPGQAQRPSLTDYADGIDTLGFLSEL